MRVVQKTINIIAALSFSTVLALLVLFLIKPTSILATFPYLTFSSTLAFCFFVLGVMLRTIKKQPFFLILVGVIVLLPIAIHTYYFVDKNYLEQMSPLFFSNLFFNAVIGILASLGVFQETKLYKLVLLTFTLITGYVIVVILLNLTQPIVYDILFWTITGLSFLAVSLTVFQVFKKN